MDSQKKDLFLIKKFLNTFTLGVYGFFLKKHLYYRLRKAVTESNVAEVLVLINNGAEVNDLSILKISVLNKDKEITELLLSHGGKANISPPLVDSYDGNRHTFSETHVTYPLLEIAIANEDIETINLLLQHGINSYQGLCQALEWKKNKITLLLVEKSKNKEKVFYIFKRFFSSSENSIDQFYNSLDFHEHLILDPVLLSVAIYINNMDVVKTILKNCIVEKTVLFESVRNYKSNVFCVLLDSFVGSDCIDLNLIQDDSKKNLLHEIAINGSREQAIYLLNKKSVKVFDINSLDDEMHTPVFYALYNQNKSVYNLLKILGADETISEGVDNSDQGSAFPPENPLK